MDIDMQVFCWTPEGKIIGGVFSPKFGVSMLETPSFCNQIRLLFFNNLSALSLCGVTIYTNDETCTFNPVSSFNFSPLYLHLIWLVLVLEPLEERIWILDSSSEEDWALGNFILIYTEG